ncbi:MAG: HAMP domain-containing histidine kinase, partial [Rhodospirillaceae bacterium]|nr:HAMP domain-containing histidine kinase [Rhodospirillaceae bacterium]
ICLIRSSEPHRAEVINLCSDAREAGIKIPIVVLMDIHAPEIERKYVEAGALAAMPWDGTEESMLRNVIRLAISLRKTEQSLRKSNNRLVQDMVTLQDERERAEAINEQYVAMAEELALAHDELEKLNQEKNKFFSIIAHDLRSPFTSLLGYTSLIKQIGDELSAEEVKTYAEHIHDGASRVFKLLENLLEWSRVQMNRIETVPSSFNVFDIAARTVDVLEPVANDKQIKIDLEKMDIKAFADPNQVDTVIRNLVNNAIKFTDAGGKITIQTSANNDVATISVIDTGRGMSDEMAAKLFNLAENVTTAGTNGEKGTGLGLLMCKELVERNGGKMSVKSKEGSGSEFSFTLPTTSPASDSDDGDSDDLQMLA